MRLKSVTSDSTSGDRYTQQQEKNQPETGLKDVAEGSDNYIFNPLQINYMCNILIFFFPVITSEKKLIPQQ